MRPLFLCFVLCFAGVLLLAETPTVQSQAALAASAPIPAQILTAKKLFIVNGDGQIVLNGLCQVNQP